MRTYNKLSADRQSRTIAISPNHSWSFGVTLWRKGAISFLWRGGVPVQIVFGDWWNFTTETIHPEAKP